MEPAEPTRPPPPWVGQPERRPDASVTVEASTSYEAATASLLAERIRRALALIALSIVLFGLLELWLQHASHGSFAAVKLVQLATLAAVAGALRRTPSWRRCIALGLVTAVEVCVTLALSGVLTDEVASAPLLFIVLTMASAALLPWGVGPQIATGATALAALGVNVASVSAIPPGFGYTAVAATLACVASVYVSHTMDRHRRSLHAALEHLRATAAAKGEVARDLAAASQAKTEFLATMSHELRTPLNIILGFAEMAEDPEVGVRERSDLVRRMRTAACELLDLVENTLHLGRIDVGHEVTHLESVDLRDVWRELGIACGRLPRKAGVALTWDEPAAIAIVTDRRKLAIIVKNLVLNALKFTERGSVDVGLVVANDTVVVRVRDTGIGIRPEDRDRIFERFAQADGADTCRYDGIGLGLHIVRRYTDAIGASLSLDSVRGLGSTFSITLPRAVTDLSVAA
jgi:signal transduction histidine kinase